MRRPSAKITEKEDILSLLSYVDNIVIYLDLDFNITKFNNLAEELYGVKQRDVLGRNYPNLCKSHGLDCPIPADTKNILEGNIFKVSHNFGVGSNISWVISRQINHTIHKPEGFIIIGVQKNNSLNYKLEEDDLIFLANQVKEVTGQEPNKYKDVKDYVKSIRAYYERIINCMPNNVYWLNRNCITLGCNDNIAKIMGLNSSEEFVGIDYDKMSVLSGWGKDVTDSFKKDDLHVMDTGVPIFNKEEPPMINNDGSAVYYISSRVPLRDEQNNIIGIVGISTNITERKRTEEELRIAKERAELASQTKSQFIQNMEHDLRTPASGVYGVLNSIVDTIQNPDLKYKMQLVTKGAKRLLDFLNDIISFDKDTSGLPITALEFDLHDMAHSVIEMEMPTVHDKNIELKLDIAKDVPQHIISDKHRILRILLNLAGNAVKFTKEGHVNISISIEKQIDPRHCLLKIIVEDTGIGIPADKIHRIYERFERCTPSNKGLYPGAGLGLSITKQFIDELQGDVQVDSKEGEGTTFTCVVPCRIPLRDLVSYDSIFNALPSITKEEEKKPSAIAFTKKLEIKPEEKTVIAQTVPLKKAKVLLVEDDEMARTLASVALENNLNANYDTADTGQKALELWGKNKYDFILMDLGLPDIKGDQVTKKIRETDKETIIIALTAHDEDKAKKLCQQVGMQGFLNKPLNVDKLLEILQDIQKAEVKTAVVDIPLVEPEVVIDEKQIFDIDICRKNGLNKEELVKKMINIFIKQLPEYLVDFESYYNDKNIEYIGLLAHKLKGGSITVGAPRLATLAENLQHLARIKKITMEDLEESYRKVCAEITEVLKVLKNLDK